MSLWDKARSGMQRSSAKTVAMAVSAMAAEWIARWLDGIGGNPPVTPEDLEAAAKENKSLLLEALSSASPGVLAQIRVAVGPLLRSMGTIPYRAILEALRCTHPQHVAVMERHREWTLAQMRAVVTWATGGRDEVG